MISTYYEGKFYFPDEGFFWGGGGVVMETYKPAADGFLKANALAVGG